MDYGKIYNQLIDRALYRNFDGYTESHHIVPRCLGGADNSENLVNLTPEEHYLAHQLLVKIYPNEPKLVYAAMMMRTGRINNKIYGWLKKRFSIIRSEATKNGMAPLYGKFWITDGNNSSTVFNEDEIPEGWRRGRTIQKLKGRSTSIKGRIFTEEEKRNIYYKKYGDKPKKIKRKRKIITWKIIDPEGIVTVTNNLHGFCKENSLHTSAMRYVAIGKYTHYKKWKCEILN